MENETIALLTLLFTQKHTTLRQRLNQGHLPSSLLKLHPESQKCDKWKRELDLVGKSKVNLISCLDSSYPKALRELPDFPLLLYVKGSLIPETTNIGVIGTRTATLYGKEQAEYFGEKLAAAGLTVVSGLARGIDTAAHMGALKSGRTFAIIGSGFHHLYPPENKFLSEKISENGALISECPMETRPAKHLFPLRNRLISGISRGLLLIESPAEGGGMITMELGQTQGKHLFALPGRVDESNFQGNHLLLKKRKAWLVDTPDDVLHHFGHTISQHTLSPLRFELSDEEKNLLSLLPNQEKTFDELVLLTQFPVMKLNVLLTRLVLKKAMKELPGKIYKKVFTS